MSCLPQPRRCAVQQSASNLDVRSRTERAQSGRQRRVNNVARWNPRNEIIRLNVTETWTVTFPFPYPREAARRRDPRRQ